jgi:hypothetical protein
MKEVILPGLTTKQRAKIKQIKAGDIVTVKQEQEAYYGSGMIQPGDKIVVNDSCTPYVFHVPGNGDFFLSGYWIPQSEGMTMKNPYCGIDQPNTNHPCGIHWSNVQIP